MAFVESVAKGVIKSGLKSARSVAFDLGVAGIVKIAQFLTARGTKECNKPLTEMVAEARSELTESGGA